MVIVERWLELGGFWEYQDFLATLGREVFWCREQRRFFLEVYLSRGG